MRRLSREAWIDVVGILSVVVVTMAALHPSLLVSSTLITGGDTGAHVALPAYLRSTGNPFNLMPWYPGWFAGMPAYSYYFVLPDALAAWAGYVINYAVAFKLATVLGSVLMPLAAYVMGRLFRAPRPVPLGLAMATLPFLFDASFTIDGGNLFSTMAGEYAFSLSLAFALVAIGLVARGVREGRGYWITAVLISLTLFAHVLPFFFVVGATALLVVLELLQRRGIGDPRLPATTGDYARPVRFVAGTALLSVGLTAWWLVPFATSQSFTNSMGYTNDNTSSLHAIFTTLGWFTSTGGAAGDRWVILLAAVGLVIAIVSRDRLGVVLGSLSSFSLVAFVVDPQGVIWNERLIPFWFVSVHLLAGWAVAWPLARWATGRRHPRRGARVADAPAPPTDALSADAGVALGGPTDGGVGGEGAGWDVAGAVTAGPPTSPEASDHVLEPVDAIRPDGAPGVAVSESFSSRRGRSRRASAAIVVLVAGLLSTVPGQITGVAKALGLSTTGNQVSSWAAWNYSGYQGKPAWPEYHDLMTTMGRVAQRDGCGRAMWEYSPSENRFGTTMALMLLPYWTNNCVSSMEGLYFESSATTPYHFLDQAELSAQPSNPQVGLPYGTLDVATGVTHLQMLGVRYFIAFSPGVVAEASRDPRLRLVATTRAWPAPGVQWRIYEIRPSPLVVGLTRTPVVVAGLSSRTAWLNANVGWWIDATRWDTPLAASGPASWPHAASADPLGLPPGRALPRESVTRVTAGLQSVSFHVSRLGVPTLVKVSYYPRWQVSGATGPYRVSPNLMVVVPTSHEVTLVYGADGATRLGSTLSGVTIALGLVVAFLAGRRRARERRRTAQ